MNQSSEANSDRDGRHNNALKRTAAGLAYCEMRLLFLPQHFAVAYLFLVRW
jgi:hypothetical protein